MLIACTASGKIPNDRANIIYAPCIFSEKNFQKNDVQWLKTNLIAINTPTLSEIKFPLKIFTNADIVGLGEATHGTHEFYDFKIDLTKYLIKFKGYRIIAFELPMPYIYVLDDYIHGKGGDLRYLLDQMGAWVMDTEEIYNFLVWLKEFNNQAKGDQMITLTGYDLPLNDPTSEISIIDKYVSMVDPENKEKIVSQLTCFNIDQYSYSLKTPTAQKDCRDNILNVLSYIQNKRANYINQSSSSQFELAINSITSLVQLEHLYASSPAMAYPLRDQYMAENVIWIHDILGKGEKRIILWGHNSHIGRNMYIRTKSGTMGYLLSQRYGRSYFNIGSTFYKGDFNALPLDINHQAMVPPEDSYETFFKSAGTPTFYIHLDQPSTPAWFSNDHCLRSVGSMYDDNTPYSGWEVDKLSDEYDGFFYVETSTPTNLFDRK